MQCDPIGDFGAMEAVSGDEPLIDGRETTGQSRGHEQLVESRFQLMSDSTHGRESLKETKFFESVVGVDGVP
jgi:hypothetical protein